MLAQVIPGVDEEALYHHLDSGDGDDADGDDDDDDGDDL